MKQLMARLPVAFFLLGAMGLSFLAGLFVTERNLFPYPQIRDTYRTIKVIMQGTGSQPYIGEFDAISDVAFADLANERFAFAATGNGDAGGYLVFGGLNQFLEHCPDTGCLAVKFDENGDMQKAVPYNMAAIYESRLDTGHEYEFVSLDPERDLRPIGMVALPDGDLLVTFQITRSAGVFPFGAGVARVADDGTPRWFRFDHSHHWPAKATMDGNFLVPGMTIGTTDVSYVISGRDRRVMDCDTDRPYWDTVRILDADGGVVEEFNVLEAFIASPFRGILRQSTSPCDPLHLNFVDVVRNDYPSGLNGIRPGDLILSLRNISAVAYYRPSTRTIVHVHRGTFVQQHSVQHVSDARFVMFDNMGGDLDGGPSRLLEFDLQTGAERTIFPRGHDIRFADEYPYTSEAGFVDVSSDRSRALVTFSYQGVAVEVDLAESQETLRYTHLQDISSVDEAPTGATAQAAVFQLFGMSYLD